MVKINYNNFMGAVMKNDSETLNDLTPKLVKVLTRYLQIRFGASTEDAEDCVQTVLMRGVKRIKEDGIEKPDSLLAYFLTSAKHEYFRIKKAKYSAHIPFVAEEHGSKAYQLEEILQEERMTILTDCIQQLNPSSREYILYWLKNPSHNAQDVADHFGINVNAAWTRKHRILKVLQACCQKKLDQ